MGKDVIIACDFSSQREVMDFLDLFPDKKPYVKIGTLRSLLLKDLFLF